MKTTLMAAILAATLALSACGADGPPEPPAARSGVFITGEAQVGVAVK